MEKNITFQEIRTTTYLKPGVPVTLVYIHGQTDGIPCLRCSDVKEVEKNYKRTSFTIYKGFEYVGKKEKDVEFVSVAQVIPRLNDLLRNAIIRCKYVNSKLNYFKRISKELKLACRFFTKSTGAEVLDKFSKLQSKTHNLFVARHRTNNHTDDARRDATEFACHVLVIANLIL